MPRLAEGLVAGVMPAVTDLIIGGIRMGDAGASAIAAALDRGAMPRLQSLTLSGAAIGDAGLAALGPALRRLQALTGLSLSCPVGDEGLTALVAPAPLAGALPPPAGGLKKLTRLNLNDTHITDVGCAVLVEALDSGALPALKQIHLDYTRAASTAAKEAVQAALARSRALTPKPRRCRGASWAAFFD